MKQKYQLYFEKHNNWLNPEDFFLSQYKDKIHSFWLDSSRVEDGLSRFSYMGYATEVISYSINKSSENIFSILEKKLHEIRIPKTNLPFDFTGGYVGYFGYETKQLLGYPNLFTSDYQDSLWLFIDKFVVFDHIKRAVFLVCLSKDSQEAFRWVNSMKKTLNTKTNARTNTKTKAQTAVKLHFRLNKKNYLGAVNKCKAYIYDGESYETCLTTQAVGTLKKDPLDIYRVLRKMNPSPYGAYIREGELAVLCSSPEQFLKIDQDGYVQTKPIKGTRKRGGTKEADHMLRKQLQNSEKDKAENLMIVDLLRNDLGKVCEVGSIQVSKLMNIESYETVHQMVSTIRGKLRKNISGIDCIKACFPGGSMTGVPKKRTIEILESIEYGARGIYSGTLGFLSANGAVELNIVIRTIVIQKGIYTIGSGGAILYQSDAKKEYAEMLLKMEPLINTLKKVG